ncbi:MAG: hypothetical protein KAI17_09980, partial [Thiotrichaceae bacterium]|nr:hypothetical protein [Thiotrichaceae bacterium]
MKKTYYMPLIMCSSLCAMSAVADDSKAELVPIEVVGQKTLSTTVISAEYLKSLAPSTSDTASLLKNVP